MGRDDVLRAVFFAEEVGGDPEEFVYSGEEVFVHGQNFVLAFVLVGFIDEREAFVVITGDELAGHFDGGGDFIGMVGVVGKDTGGELFKTATSSREGVEGGDDLGLFCLREHDGYCGEG